MPKESIDPELLNILACPLCKADVKLEEEKLFCTNQKCNMRFKIKEGIPIMLIHEAERPCPACGTNRNWVEDLESLVCPKCGEKFKAPEL